MPTDLPPIEEILPHRGAMRLVDRVLAWDAQQVALAVRVDAGAWYLEDGGAIPSWIGVELLAQAIAAHGGLLARARGEIAKPGLLLGARKYRAKLPRLPGVDLTVRARQAFKDASGLAAYDGSIELRGEEVAAARLIVFSPPDFSRFISAQSRLPA